MWGEHSKREYKWIMISICIFFSVIVLGSIIPFIETTMTVVIVTAIVVGVIGLIWYWIEEARKMKHVMNAPIEELIEESRKNDPSQ